MSVAKEKSGVPERVNRRHLLGFRRFQLAALKALTVAVSALGEAGERPPAVKVGDMKSLVSAYKEAVAGERTVLGLGGGHSDIWPEEMVVRWVEDEAGTSKEDEVEPS